MRTIGVLVLLCISAMAAAQPRASETISIVNIDVVVTDSSGKRITGLTADDFEIRERGKVQPITHFAAYAPAAGGETAEASAQADLSRPPRTVVVFIESSELMPAEVDQLYDAIRKLLRETVVAPHDRAAVIGWQGRATVRHPFTRDLDAIETSLARMQRAHKVSPRDQNGLEALAREQRESDAAEAERRAAGDGEAVVPEGDEAFGTMPSVYELDYAVQQLVRIRNKAAAVETLLNSMGAIEGRKIAILAMNRFGLVAGAEGTESGTVSVDARRTLSNEKLHNAVIRAANANDVVLYPFYPADGKRSAKQHNIVLNEAMGLDELAKETGGLMSWGTSNIAELLPRVAEDLETYYSLGYRAPASGKDVTREIEVRAKNDNYKVRSRTQFVEKSAETLMRERVLANLYHGLGESMFGVEVVLGKRRGEQAPLRVRVAAGDLPELPESDRRKPRALTFYVVSGSGLRAASDVQRRAQAFPLPKTDGDEVAYFSADFTLRVDDKASAVSVAVVDDATQEVGYARVQLAR